MEPAVQSYGVDVHQHRFSAWAAATAASASPLCRFSVQQGVAILEASGFTATAMSNPDLLPDPAVLDADHQTWRNQVMVAARQRQLKFTHGVAAKLINCYLKARFTCAGHHTNPRVQALHPPIDAVLLLKLAELNVGGRGAFWRGKHRERWSRFDSSQYQAVIDAIRHTLQGKPMWTIEEHWQGHQGPA